MLVGFGLIAVLVVFIGAVGVVGAAAATYARAATAADAAALASAPVTFRPFGARGSPRQEASRFARINGTRLVSCSCPVNRAWIERTVSVTVARTITLPLVGEITVTATSRAVFDPTRLLPDGSGVP
ncbi:MAG: hypothetical protein R2823_08880 [Acidimicrobiia bacterium]